MIDASNFRMPPARLILPSKWRRTNPTNPLIQCAYIKTTVERLLVIVGEECHQGRWWRHVSASTPFAVPDFQQLIEVKDLFVGKELKAIHVFPKESEKVNIARTCVHLWVPLEHDPLPDFRAIFGGEAI